MLATQIRTVLTGINPKALTPPGISGVEATNGAGLTQGTSLWYGTPMEFGPWCDVAPYVLNDGFTVNLTLLASVTEFAGYDQPTNSVTVYVEGKPWGKSLPEVRPHFNVRELAADLNLYDGQAVVLSRPIDPSTGQPVEPSGKKAKHLLVLATVSVVDGAANRVHTDDQIAFARDQVAPQPPPWLHPPTLSTFGGKRSPEGDWPIPHRKEGILRPTGPGSSSGGQPIDQGIPQIY